MLRPLLFLCLATGLAGSLARADEPDAPLVKAKRGYYETTDKARNELLEAFAAASKAATASGSLDVVKTLKAEKESFETSGRLPTSARLKTAVTTYQATVKTATITLERAFEQTVKDLTKAGKLDQAATVQAELKEFRTKATITNLKPTDVATKEDLQRYLGGTAWNWGDGIKLKPDGYVEAKSWDDRGLVTKWEAVDRRTVILLLDKGRDINRLAVLTFNEDLAEFSGYDFNGKDRIPVSKRKP